MKCNSWKNQMHQINIIIKPELRKLYWFIFDSCAGAKFSMPCMRPGRKAVTELRRQREGAPRSFPQKESGSIDAFRTHLQIWLYQHHTQKKLVAGTPTYDESAWISLERQNEKQPLSMSYGLGFYRGDAGISMLGCETNLEPNGDRCFHWHLGRYVGGLTFKNRGHSGVHPFPPYKTCTLPETDIAAWNWAIPKGNSSSKHPFSGAMLVAGRGNIPNKKQCYWKGNMPKM